MSARTRNENRVSKAESRPGLSASRVDEDDDEDDDMSDDDSGDYGGVCVDVDDDDGGSVSVSASYVETSVLLGYAGDRDGSGGGEDEGNGGGGTDDDDDDDDAGSYLGGLPTWLSNAASPAEASTPNPPSAILARCFACGDLMSLLLQLNANLPERFPGHERRLYVFACRRKTCRRKEGCVGVVRGVRVDCEGGQVEGKVGDGTINGAPRSGADQDGRLSTAKKREVSAEAEQPRLGDAIFGVSKYGVKAGEEDKQSTKIASVNPFSTKDTTGSRGGNPFALPGTAPLATKMKDSAPAAVSSSTSSLPPPSSSRSDSKPKNSAADTNKFSTTDSSSLPERFTSALQISSNPDPTAQSTSGSTPAAMKTATTPSYPPKTAINTTTAQSQPHEAWPPNSAFPPPYPRYPLEADYETLDRTPTNNTINNPLSPLSSKTPPSSSSDAMQIDTATSAVDEKQTFESSLDRTFQRFADRLAQNPEQVLRYEFGGDPLLYAGAADEVGKLFVARAKKKKKTEKKKKAVAGRDRDRDCNGRAGGGDDDDVDDDDDDGREGAAVGIPACPNCNGPRVFEVQLTPYAIEKLEDATDADEIAGGKGGGNGGANSALDGMDWGTIIVGVCQADCRRAGVRIGQVDYLQEWVGVQWEELEGEG